MSSWIIIIASPYQTSSTIISIILIHSSLESLTEALNTYTCRLHDFHWMMGTKIAINYASLSDSKLECNNVIIHAPTVLIVCWNTSLFERWVSIECDFQMAEEQMSVLYMCIDHECMTIAMASCTTVANSMNLSATCRFINASIL